MLLKASYKYHINITKEGFGMQFDKGGGNLQA
jgi:hypothetical protein